MPNHVKNVWKIANIPPDQIQYVLDKITIKVAANQIIDFDLIIPEPRLKSDCPKDCIVNKDSYVAEDETRPWFNWYDWRNKYWNTKWGAYDGYTEIGKTYIRCVFNTAWSFAFPIANKLADLGYNLDLRYADEDIGANCGRITYSKDTGSWTAYTDEDLPNANEFAKRLWTNY